MSQIYNNATYASATYGSPPLSRVERLLASRRAFPSAQELLGGVPVGLEEDVRSVGWHGTAFHPETGCVALVGPAFTDLVGETILIAAADRSVFVYVIGIRNLQFDLSLARRPFLALGGLYNTSLPCVASRVRASSGAPS